MATLIDKISDEDWNDPDVADWNINVGLPIPEQVRDMFPTRDGFGKRVWMDMRREGQPISTDEFLSKLALNWNKIPTASDFQDRACLWIMGNFTEAMEGLE